MLKTMRGPVGARSRGWAVVWLCLMGVAALAVSTVRGPYGVANAQEAVTGKPKAPANVNGEALTKYLPGNADLVAVVRPGQLFSSPLGKMSEALGEGPGPFTGIRALGLDAAKFEEIAIGAIIGSNPRPVGVVVARYSESDKLPASLSKEKPAGDVGGVTLFDMPEVGFVWGSIDSKTVIIGSVLEVTKALSGGKGAAILERKAWGTVKSSPFAVIVKSEAIRAAAKSDPTSTANTPQSEFRRMLLTMGMAAPFWEETDAIALQLQAEREIHLMVHSESGSEAQAKEVVATASALATLGRNFLKSLQETGQLKQPVQILLADAARETLATMKTATAGNSTSISLMLANQERVAAILPGLVSSARMEAAKATSMNNMKQIAIALHNYNDTYGHMPPAILYGPDGKTPYSWRVAILPFIEQEVLYRQYKFDEPWDSENNKKVLAQVPRVFQDPSEQGKSTNTSYFAVAAVNTILHLGAKGASMAQITDGTSNTIMVVDAKKEAPWTKPEDVGIDTPASMLGFQKDVFFAAMGDGSVRAISKTIDATMLKWLFIRDDGNVVVIP